jgi:PBP1b-binding outer membrane lipoprotein LpoB
MTHLVAMAIVITTTLAGCGVETATTAATVAAARKQELEQGKKQLDQVKQRIETAMEESRQRSRRTEAASQ